MDTHVSGPQQRRANDADNSLLILCIFETWQHGSGSAQGASAFGLDFC